MRGYSKVNYQFSSFLKAFILTFFSITLIYFSMVRECISEEPAGAGKKTAGDGAVPVVVDSLRKRTFYRKIKVEGTLESKHSVYVSPRLPGTIERLFVDEGYEVEAGRTKLFETDSLKLQKAVEVARQNLVVARCAREEREAYLQQLRLEFAKAERDFRRIETLYSKKVTSQEQYDNRKTGYEKARAMLKHGESLLALAKEEEKKAATALAIAEKDLEDTVIIAPITGKISKKLVEAGTYGAPGVPVFRIDDVKNLEVVAHLPAEYYKDVHAGTTVVALEGPDGWMNLRVSCKSPAIDPALRTFLIKCDVEGDEKTIVPGALVTLEVIISSRDALGVPSSVIERRGGERVIFTTDGGFARMIPVKTGLETDGWTEISGKNLVEGMRIVVKGQFLLEDGKPVTVVESLSSN